MSNYSRTLDLKGEELMLRSKVELLEDFLAQGSRGQVVREMRCRALEDKIASMEATIVRTGQLEAARSYLGNPGFLKDYPTTSSSRPSDSSIYDCGLGNSNTSSPNSSGTRPDSTALESNKRQSSVSSGTSSPKRSPQLDHKTPPQKRMKLGEQGQAPCLRCRMLKKKCDSLAHCTHCPQQNFDSKNDYWKVLGCIRGGLREIAAIFCPDSARSTRRTFRCKSGVLLVIDFNLTKSKVSIGKKNRILQLIQTRSDFAGLSHEAWEMIDVRQSLCRIAAKPSGPAEASNLPATSNSLCEDYEAPWALLQAVGMDPYYSQRTRYNAFSLFRLGNSFSSANHALWSIYRKSRQLLRQAVELYLLERLCGFVVSEDLVGSPPFDKSKLPSSNTLVLIDMKEDMEDFLHDFERICAGRAKLSGDTQLACFYALLVFSITRSLLIDVHSVRAACDDEYAVKATNDEVSPRKGTYALQINSAYQSLVSLFSWSSKADVMLLAGRDNTSDGSKETSMLVNLPQWDQRGFKSTKDFLFGLGSVICHDGTYNAFFAQKFYVEGLRETPPPDALYEHMYRSGTHGVAETVLSPPRAKEPTKPPYTIHKFNVSSVPRATEGQEEAPDSPSTLSPGSDFHCPGTPNHPLSSGASNPPELGGTRPQNFTFVGHGHEDNRNVSTRLRGGRRGALDDATSKKAREIRKVGACWNCWVMKVPCSEGHPCVRCKPTARGAMYRTCSRSPFTAHSDLFFLDGYNSRFTTGVVQLYIHDNIASFADHSLLVEISWIGNRNMALNATCFTVTAHGTAHQRYPGQSDEVSGVESLPVGLAPFDIPIAQQSCMRYFESILSAPSSSASIFSSSMPTLSKRVIEAIYCYHQSMREQNTLLHDALLSHLILTAMSQPVKFTAASAASIVKELNIQCSPSESFSSRMLDRQMKQILYSLNRIVINRLLANLEKLIRGRKASSWTVCFCTILMLSFSMEQVQIQTWFHVRSLKSILPWQKQIPIAACLVLDKLPFSQFSHLFHSIYRTTQADKGGLNPLYGTFKSHHEDLFDATAMNLIRTIRAVLVDVAPLNKSTQKPDFDQGFTQFIQSNSGRLVSQFLAPFISREASVEQVNRISEK